MDCFPEHAIQHMGLEDNVMGEQTIRNSVRAALFGAAALTASIGWAQEQESEPATSTPSATTQTEPTQTGPTETAPPEASSEASTDAADATAPTSPDLAAKSAGVPLDDQKIEKFADAYVAVQKIQTEAAGELDKSAADPAQQQQTQAAVESQMIAAVERTGLKLDEFNGIVQTMTADADLRARVVAKIRERMGG
jgi:cytoskeletal protein RodZ